MDESNDHPSVDVYGDLLNLTGETPYVALVEPYKNKLRGFTNEAKLDGFKKSFHFAKNVGKSAIRRLLRTYFGSPDSEWFASAAEKVKEMGFGTIGNEFHFPIAESLDECLPLANLMVCFGVLNIPFKNTEAPAKFTANSQFERDLTNVTSWLVLTCTDQKCAKIKPFDREFPVRNNVSILKSLIVRQQMIDKGTYVFAKKIIKDLCGETEGCKQFGLSYVLQSVPRDLKDFFRSAMNMILRELSQTIKVSGNYFKQTSLCLNWQNKVVKRDRETLSIKIKPHVSNSIRYFPNDLREVKDTLMPATAEFREWYDIKCNEPATKDLVSEGNKLLERSYSEFYTERRLFRESYYAYINMHNLNLIEYEDTYVSSSHFLGSVLNHDNKWLNYCTKVKDVLPQGEDKR